MIPQVRRCDGGDGVHTIPQDSGNFGSIWLLFLDAVLLLHRRQTAVRDDWPVRPPDVQPDVSILVRIIHSASHFCVLLMWMRWNAGTTRGSSTSRSSITLFIAPPLSPSALFGQALYRGFGGLLRRAENLASNWESTIRRFFSFPLFSHLCFVC
jgi:hypothetical protein